MAERKLQIGDFCVHGDHITRVIDDYYKRPRGEHTYYALTCGHYIRADRLSRFNGCIISTEGDLIKEGDPKKGTLVVTKGRWVLVPWQGNLNKASLQRYPKVREWILYQRSLASMPRRKSGK